MKKVTGLRAKEHYTKLDPLTGELIEIQPEYITMSLGRKKGEGIGGPFYKKYKTDFFPSDECPVPGRGVYKKVPKYYENLLKEDDPDTHSKIKRRRAQYQATHREDHTTARLESRYTVKKAQLKQLPRHKEP